MAKPRKQEYPTPEPGSVADILEELLRRDGRSMRALSLAAGLAGDACRNIRRHAAQPRPQTLAALAKALGVDVRVLLGQAPIPDTIAQPSASAAPATSPHSTPFRAAADVPRLVLRNAVRAAMKQSHADGLPVKWALSDVILAAMLWAVAAGMDDVEAAETVGSIGIPEYG